MKYYEEVLDNTAAAIKYGLTKNEIVSYKKKVHLTYGRIWFEVQLVDGRILTSNMPGH
jgi:hypothetical protein